MSIMGICYGLFASAEEIADMPSPAKAAITDSISLFQGTDRGLVQTATTDLWTIVTPIFGTGSAHLVGTATSLNFAP
jgi:hypothetical protein